MIDVDSYIVTLAQDAPPPAYPEGQAASTGAPAGGGGAPPPSPFGGNFFFLILIMIVAMIMFSLFGQRREKKKRDAMLNAIKKHDTVQTVGGVIGSIVEVKPETVILKVDESSNIRMTFARSAIQQVIAKAPGGSGKAAGLTAELSE